VIYDLVFIPGRGRKASPEDVLRHFGTTDGHALGLRLLRDAADREDGIDADAALMVCHVFDMTEDHLELLVQLAPADWHREHEEVASALESLHLPAAVDALYHLTQWVPGYLAWDEDRGLARKAVWGLSRTPGPEAEQALRLLLDDPDEHVRAYAAKRQSRRDQSLVPIAIVILIAGCGHAFYMQKTSGWVRSDVKPVSSPVLAGHRNNSRRHQT